MRSVIVGTDFITTMPANGLQGLTRGQVICVDSNGLALATAANVERGSLIKFVVGLGDGKTKSGVWINPYCSHSNYTAYAAPTPQVLTVSNIVFTPPTTTPSYVNLRLSIRSKNYLTTYPIKWFDIYYDYDNANVTIADFTTAFEAYLQRRINEINVEYGMNIVTLAIAGTGATKTYTFTTAAGEWVDVGLEGMLSGDITKTGGDPGAGVGKLVAYDERNEDVASVGYDPNYPAWQDKLVYGDIFLADAGGTYNTTVIQSRTDRTHPFDINTLGMETWQWIAMSTAYTGTDLATLIASMSPDVSSLQTGIAQNAAAITQLDSRVTALEP